MVMRMWKETQLSHMQRYDELGRIRPGGHGHGHGNGGKIAPPTKKEVKLMHTVKKAQTRADALRQMEEVKRITAEFDTVKNDVLLDAASSVADGGRSRKSSSSSSKTKKKKKTATERGAELLEQHAKERRKCDGGRRENYRGEHTKKKKGKVVEFVPGVGGTAEIARKSKATTQAKATRALSRTRGEARALSPRRGEARRGRNREQFVSSRHPSKRIPSLMEESLVEESTEVTFDEFHMSSGRASLDRRWRKRSDETVSGRTSATGEIVRSARICGVLEVGYVVAKADDEIYC